jgi:hypothetical protein
VRNKNGRIPLVVKIWKTGREPYPDFQPANDFNISYTILDSNINFDVFKYDFLSEIFTLQSQAEHLCDIETCPS